MLHMASAKQRRAGRHVQCGRLRGTGGAVGKVEKFGARQLGRTVGAAQMEEAKTPLRGVFGDEGAAALLARQHALAHKPIRRAADGADGAAEAFGEGFFGWQRRAWRKLAGGDFGDDGGADLTPDGRFDIHAGHLGHIVDLSSMGY